MSEALCGLEGEPKGLELKESLKELVAKELEPRELVPKEREPKGLKLKQLGLWRLVPLTWQHRSAGQPLTDVPAALTSAPRPQKHESILQAEGD